MDLGTIQYNVEANTTDIDKANAAVDNMAQHMDEAGQSADNLGKKVKKTSESTGEMAKGAKKASESIGEVEKASSKASDSVGELEKASKKTSESISGMEKAAGKSSEAIGGVSKKAGQAGIQFQQFIGQVQGGQSVFGALSAQAADLGIVLGAPLIGAVVGISASIIGALVPSLFKAGEEVKAVSELTKELVKDFKDFDDAQKKIVSKGIAVSVSDLTNQMLEAAKEAGEAKVKLDEQSKKVLASYGGKLKLRSGEGIEKEVAALALAQEKVLSFQRQINDLQDPTKTDKKLKSLQEENAITGLVGRAYWELKAAQEGVEVSRKEEYIAAGLSLDKKKEDLKLAEQQKQASKQEADRLDREAKQKQKLSEAEETRRADSIKKLEADMKREADLFGETSEEKKVAYGIEHGLIKTKNDAEKQGLLIQARRIDQLNSELALQRQLDAEIQDREEKDKKAKDEANVELQKRAESIADMINDGLMRGFESGKGIIENFRDTVENVFKTLVLRPSVEIATAELSKTVGGILGRFGKKDSATGITSGASGALGALGPYGAIGLAIGGSLISSWNSKQDAKFEKLTAAYRQGVQSTGTVLGEANKKSESIANSISNLGDTAANTLDVNHEMYQALLDIREGITGVAAGFARTVDTSSLTSGIKTGQELGGISSGLKSLYNKTGLGQITDSLGTLGGFINGAFDKVASLISSKKTKVIDSGIKIVGSNLADILEKGTIEAFSYADVKTTKKFLGVTTSTKVKESTQALDDVFEAQFASVFADAGKALQEASKTFGAEFDPTKLMVDTSKLSLKGLEGDALTKEIENFFSSTLDKWAGVLVGGTDALEKFQKVGEGAFETIVRLAAETNTFASYADKLNFNFNLVGMGAIEATQNIAELSGGFGALSGALSNYYRNFFTDSERTAQGLAQISDELSKVGISLPETREGFRAIVEGLDLSTEAGQKQFSVLMGLSGAFAELVPATKEAENSVDDMAKKLRDAAGASFDALSRSIDAERDRISTIVDNASKAKSALEASVGAEKDAITQAHNAKLEELKAQADAERAAQEAINKASIDSLEEQKSVIEDSVKGLQSLIGGISNAINDMAVKSNALTAARRRAAEFEIETALRNARAGRLPTMESLSGAIGALGGGSSTFSSFAEMARATAITQNQLKAISDIAGAKLSSDEQMLAAITTQIDIAKATKEVISNKFDGQTALEDDAYKKQISSLDQILANAQTQYDALTGIDTKTLSLTDAIAKYNESLLAADFTNAEALQARLDAIKDQAKSQVDVLNGIDISVLTLNDSFIKFADAINAASANSQKEMLDKMQSLVDEVSTLRSQSLTYNEAIAKNTGSTAANTKSIYKDGVTIIETVPA